MKSRSIIIFLLMLSFSHIFAKEYNLSKRSIEELKILNEHVKDAEERQKFANAILLIAPFQALLGSPSADTAIEIAEADWEFYGKASQGLAIHFRSQLKQFCEFEALKQNNSKDDYQFWLKLSKEFAAIPENPKKSEELKSKITAITGEIEKIKSVWEPKRKNAIARQKNIKLEEKKIEEWRQKGKEELKKNQQEMTAVIELGEWIERNIVAEDGTVDANHPKYIEYTNRAAASKKKKIELSKDTKEFRNAEETLIAESKALIPAIAEANQLSDKIKKLEKELAELQSKQ